MSFGTAYRANWGQLFGQLNFRIFFCFHRIVWTRKIPFQCLSVPQVPNVDGRAMLPFLGVTVVSGVCPAVFGRVRRGKRRVKRYSWFRLCLTGGEWDKYLTPVPHFSLDCNWLKIQNLICIIVLLLVYFWIQAVFILFASESLRGPWPGRILQSGRPYFQPYCLPSC